MSVPSANETWILEEGHKVIGKEAKDGKSSLTQWERLVYCLWVADYGMRNAGDLGTAQDLYADFHSEGERIAKGLSLSMTSDFFALPRDAFQREYFDRFELVCNELKRVGLDGREEKK
ncbi:hypothetical protein EPO15_01600 [bacterium]|nr:MAG: hypothetical protein EPO15_01600 [bacterium]